MPTASYAGTNYALQAAPKVGTWPNAAASNGQLYCLSDECFASGGDLLADSRLYVGILPVGAVVQFSIIWPIDTATFGEGDNWTVGTAKGSLGITGDTDLFGDVTDLNATATPQVIEPKPDGTTYTSTLDFALRTETTVFFTTDTAALTATEGIAVKILYTMAGRTY